MLKTEIYVHELVGLLMLWVTGNHYLYTFVYLYYCFCVFVLVYLCLYYYTEVYKLARLLLWVTDNHQTPPPPTQLALL